VALAVLLSLAAATRASGQVLFWLDTNYGAPTLIKSDLSGITLASHALPPGSLPEGLALDATGGLYWAEAAYSGAKLERAISSLSSFAPLTGIGSSGRGVAVDAVAGYVYWTTSNLVTGATLMRCALDGSGVTQLLALGTTANPRGIAVDHAGGYLYWADFDQGIIYRSALDGTTATAWLLVGSTASPYGLAIDPGHARIYWTEYATGNLRRATTPGGIISPVLTGLANPTYLTADVTGQRLYWAEGAAGSQHIRSATTSGAGLVTLSNPLTTYGGLVYQADPTLAAPEPALPVEFALLPRWTSPGSGPFAMSYALPCDARVRLAIVDLQGREVARLADRAATAGMHEASWQPRANERAGVYFVRFEAAGRDWVRRVVLIR
jgi:DNA-binding beta-propeller fold protein YncE